MKRSITLPLETVVVYIKSPSDYEILKNFIKAVKESYDEVKYSISNAEKIERRLKIHYEDFLNYLKSLGIYETYKKSRIHIFKEDGEDSIEEMIKDKEAFYKWAILHIETKLHALREKASHEKQGNIEAEIEKYEGIKKRIEIKEENLELARAEKNEEQESEIKKYEDIEKQIEIKEENLELTRAEKQLENKEKIAYIHIDIANITPLEFENYEDLWNWIEFLKSLVYISKQNLNVNKEKVYIYLEGYSPHKTATEKPKGFEGFIYRFRNLKLDANFILKTLELLGAEILQAQKEAEQLIPDKIREIEKDNPNALHVIISDDKSRDTTECDLRIIYNKRSKENIERLGKNKKVISLRDIYKENPYIFWFLKKIIKQQIELTEEEKEKEIQELEACFNYSVLEVISGDMKKELENDIESFSLLSLSDRIYTISKLLGFYRKNKEEFKKFWNGIDFKKKDKFIKELKERNSHFRNFLLILFLEVEDDLNIKGEIAKWFKENNFKELAEILEHYISEEMLKIEFENLSRKLKRKEEIKKEIEEYNNKIEHYKKLQKDENINEENLKRKKEEYEKVKSRYEELKGKIEKYNYETQNLKNQIKHLENEKTKLESEIKNLTNQNNSLKNEVEQKGKIYENLRKENEELLKKKQELDNNLTYLRNRNNQLKPEIQNYEKEKATLEKEVSENEHKLKEYEQLKEKYNKLKEIEFFTSEIQRLEQSNLDFTQNIENLRIKKEELENHNKILEKENQKLENEVNDLIKRKNKLENKNNALKKQKEEIGDVDKLEEEVKNLEDEVKMLKNKKSELEQRKVKASKELTTLRPQVEELEKEVQEYESEKKELEDREKTLKTKKMKLELTLKDLRERRQMYKHMGKEDIVKKIDEFVKKAEEYLNQL